MNKYVGWGLGLVAAGTLAYIFWPSKEGDKSDSHGFSGVNGPNRTVLNPNPPAGGRIYKWTNGTEVWCSTSNTSGGNIVPCPVGASAKAKPTYTGQSWNGNKWVTDKG